MLNYFLLTLACFSLPSQAATELAEATTFLSWLEKNEENFAQCEPSLKNDHYILCDNTEVSKSELKRLFQLKTPELLQVLKSKDLKVELICATEKELPLLSKECKTDSSNKMFSEITTLRGKFLPEDKIILIRKSASVGSLVHEYIHSLQAVNSNEIYGKAYKKRRMEIQHGLVDLMDQKIAIIEGLEKTGKKAEIAAKVKEFTLASDAPRAFAPWQDLIDERGIFLLYLKFGKEFGASDADLSLARKNLGFICKNPKLEKLIPKKQCGL